QDKRYQQNHDYLFVTTIISGNELDKTFPPSLDREYPIKISSNGFKVEQQPIQKKQSGKLTPQKLIEVLYTSPLQLLTAQETGISEEVLLKMSPEKQLELVKKYLQFLLDKLE
ncbi:MAG: hypothetical protein ACRDEA_16930, partial [Microcystaceae cyanobacterium]